MSNLEFSSNYWRSKTDFHKSHKRDCFNYDSLTRKIKETKHLIGIKIKKMAKNKNKLIYNTAKTEMTLHLIINYFNMIEEELKGVFTVFESECSKIQHKIATFISFPKNGGTIALEQVFINSAKEYRETIHLIDYAMAHLVATRHLIKKLENELKTINIKCWEEFKLYLNRKISDETNHIIKLLKANSINNIIKLLQRLHELLTLNSKGFLIYTDSDKKTFDAGLELIKEAKTRISTARMKYLRMWTKELNNNSRIFLSLDKKHLTILNANFEALNKNIQDKLISAKFPKKSMAKNSSISFQFKDKSFKKVNPILVLAHTFMFMLIYYANAPTSSFYSDALKIPSSLTGIVQAMTPLAAFISTFMYNSITDGEFTTSYIISNVCLTFGAFLYFIAKTLNLIPLLILGRIMIGYGGGRVITRTYMGTQIPEKYRTAWSSYLVAVTSLTMTLGPGISSFLEFIPSFDVFGMLETRSYNIFSLFHFLSMILFNVFFWGLFKEESTKNEQVKQTDKVVRPPLVRNNIYSLSGEQSGAMVVNKSSKSKESSMRGIESIISYNHSVNIDELECKTKENAKNHYPGLSVINNAARVKEYFPVYFLTIYFTITKMIQEGVISEIPQTMKHLYSWNSQDIGFLMLSFTPITMLFSILPGILAHKFKFENKAIMLGFSFLVLLGILLKIDFSNDDLINQNYYIATSCFLFVMTLAAEVSMTAMFGIITPQYIAASFWNAGLLSGLGGTLGRTLGNAEITFFRSMGGPKELNYMMYISQFVIFLVFLIVVLLKYTTLVKRFLTKITFK